MTGISNEVKINNSLGSSDTIIKLGLRSFRACKARVWLISLLYLNMVMSLRCFKSKSSFTIRVT